MCIIRGAEEAPIMKIGKLNRVQICGAWLKVTLWAGALTLQMCITNTPYNLNKY